MDAVAELDAYLVLASGWAVRVPALLAYDALDPYAVRITFQPFGAPPVRWDFARGLLAEGTVGCSGEGDVRIWPGSAGDWAMLHLLLLGPETRALFLISLSSVLPWLERTYELVPDGAESRPGELDEELSRLLNEMP
ncbi:SsgA family sporulation/cell division regulator [Streptomyces albidoflavus]|uniref:SsgA family sporulation/cell division regulator n=1 Tax=Streptomyces albidoflavus TaxID=1886 RepID=UPI00101E684A|nr:SsgA family sporulation/cell division regulator [Streptomyces albidoflavus]RZD76783.1 SsgA family sporulation/cell division regulator [Streptomyces albidoflavus]